MAIIIHPDTPPKSVIPTEAERRANPYGGSIAQPNTTAVKESTKTPPPLQKTRISNKEALETYYGTDDAAKIEKLPGMKNAGQYVDVEVDPEYLISKSAAGMYSKSPHEKKILVRSMSLQPYENSTIAHELAHNLFDLDGNFTMSDWDNVLEDMPEKYKDALGETLTMKEIPAYMLEAVRSATQRDWRMPPVLDKYIQRAGGSIERAAELLSADGIDIEELVPAMRRRVGDKLEVQREFPHPALHPEGIDRGIDRMLEYLTGPGQGGHATKIATVAKKYKPLRDYLKWLFQTYGEGPKVKIEDGGFTVNEVA